MFAFSQHTQAGTIHHKSCYPTFAIDPITRAQTDAAELAGWPDTSGSDCEPYKPVGRNGCTPKRKCKHKKQCRVPSAKGKGNEGDPFPVYYVVRKCIEM